MVRLGASAAISISSVLGPGTETENSKRDRNQPLTSNRSLDTVTVCQLNFNTFRRDELHLLCIPPHLISSHPIGVKVENLSLIHAAITSGAM